MIGLYRSGIEGIWLISITVTGGLFAAQRFSASSVTTRSHHTFQAYVQSWAIRLPAPEVKIRVTLNP